MVLELFKTYNNNNNNNNNNKTPNLFSLVLLLKINSIYMKSNIQLHLNTQIFQMLTSSAFYQVSGLYIQDPHINWHAVNTSNIT